MLPLLSDYVKFNVWANRQFVQWLQDKPSDLLIQEMPSSMPTIMATLLHIWGAEEIWLYRLRKLPTPVFLPQRFQGTNTDVFEGLLKQSEDFAEYAGGLSEQELQEICPFKLLNGSEDSRPRYQMIHHCMNHSTYHRGQLVTMGRNAGLNDPPSTDFIKYVRQL